MKTLIRNATVVVPGETLRADGQGEFDVGAARPGAVFAHAVRAARRPEVLAVAIVDQGIELGIGPRDHVAAAPAIAAVRSAARDELLPQFIDRHPPHHGDLSVDI